MNSSIKFNKKIIIENFNKSIRPCSVNTFFKKRYNSPIGLSNENINQSYFNKKIYTNNDVVNNNILKINSYLNKKLRLSAYNNDKINESNIPENKTNYDNLSVRIFNLYNIKDKNKPFSIKINNNNPKYYINNGLNQVLLKKLNFKKRNKNTETSLNEKINNNSYNNRFILSLVSPKIKSYKRINFAKIKNEKIININSKNTKKIDELKINKNNLRKKRKKLILDKYDDYSFTNVREKQNDNRTNDNYNSNINENNLDEISTSQIGKFDEYFYNSGKRIYKNYDFNDIMKENKKYINNQVLNSNLTLESPKLIYNNPRNYQKYNKINNTQVKSFLNIKHKYKNTDNNIFINNNSGKGKIKNIKSKKENKALNSFFDLKSNQFESETLKKIIKDFIENEEKQEKIELCDKDNKKINNKLQTQIQKQKEKLKTLLKDNNMKEVPKIIKKIKNNDCDIYLQYDQNNNVKKILLNDRKGNITSFIPSTKTMKK